MIEFKLNIIIESDDGMTKSYLEEYIRDYILKEGWSGAFCTNFIYLKSLELKQVI
jgi:hypothetical protein